MNNSTTRGKTVHIGRDDDEIKIEDLTKKLFFISNFNPEIERVAAPLGSVERRCPDITKLKELGYKPHVNLDEGLRECYEWYRHKISY